MNIQKEAAFVTGNRRMAIGRMRHVVTAHYFRNGGWFGDEQAFETVFSITQDTVRNEGKASAIRQGVVIGAVCSAVCAYLQKCEPIGEWRFVSADQRITNSLNRPDLMFINSSGQVIADELKFAGGLTQADFDQVRRYAADFDAVGSDVVGLRLLLNADLSRSFVLTPVGANFVPATKWTEEQR